MTATYRPIRCPHGTDSTHTITTISVVTVYADGCRATSGAPVRFWCGLAEMLKPNGVSITEGEYLRDWQDAIDEASHRWTAERKAAEDAHDASHYQAMLDDLHAEALILNEGDELYDDAENEDYHCTWEAVDRAELRGSMQLDADEYYDRNPRART